MGQAASAITSSDRIILRDLARHQMELANAPKNKKLEKDWMDLNSFRSEKPLIHLELWTFMQDVIPPLLKCESDAGRDIEMRLYCNFANQEILGDDRVVTPYFPIRWKTCFNLFGHEAKTVHARNSDGNTLGHQFVPLINDLEEDYEKLKESSYGYDKEGSLREEEELDSLFGDILPVKRISDCLYAVPTQLIVHFMGMENMYFSMCDYPELFKEMMNRAADDYISYFKFLQDNSLLIPTVGAEGLSQGTYCFTEELPAAMPEDRPLSTEDVWGFMDSQETVGISPGAFEEFIFPAYKKVAGVFGLLSYGCCEPVHPIWSGCLSKLPNLRKVSISPWCDEEYMGNILKGKKIVYQRKPSPNFLGVGKDLDEDAVCAHFKKTLEAAKGCTLEITQRDVYTIAGSVLKARRYIELIRRTIEENWQG